MQFPHLLGDSVCCGRIQNARRTVQHAVSTPFGGFCMLRQNPECAPDRPTCSFHTFCGILYAAAEYRMQGVECKDTGKRRLQQNPRFLRIQNPGLQFLFPHPQPPLTTGSRRGRVTYGCPVRWLPGSCLGASLCGGYTVMAHIKKTSTLRQGQAG